MGIFAQVLKEIIEDNEVGQVVLGRQGAYW